jgi:D-tyrosyl-tRNA(Tyr) deacylase
MRLLAQRVSQAAVRIEGHPVGAIGRGLLVYAAFRRGDSEADLDWMAEKVAHLRIFEDDGGKMNRSVQEAGGAVLVVPEFTLYGDARKGRRPSFDASAPPVAARPLFEKFVDKLAGKGLILERGRFQATMQVESVNDGPVTLLLESPQAA